MRYSRIIQVYVFALAMMTAVLHGYSQDKYSDHGFGGAKFSWTQLNGSSTVEAGGHGAKFLSDHFFLGGEGYGLGVKQENTEYDMGYGGILCGYVFNPDQKIQFTSIIMVGLGGVTEYEDNEPKKEDFISIIKPTLELDYRITDWFKAGISLSYRQVLGTNDISLNNSNLSAPVAGITLKFGNFYTSKRDH